MYIYIYYSICKLTVDFQPEPGVVRFADCGRPQIWDPQNVVIDFGYRCWLYGLLFFGLVAFRKSIRQMEIFFFLRGEKPIYFHQNPR